MNFLPKGRILLLNMYNCCHRWNYAGSRILPGRLLPGYRFFFSKKWLESPLSPFGRSPEYFARKDKIDLKRQELVYNSFMHNYLHIGHSMVLMFMPISAIIYYLKYFQNDIPPHNEMTRIYVPGLLSYEIATVISVVFCFAALAGLSLRRIPVRMYFNKKEQNLTVIFHSLVPGRKIHKIFMPGSVTYLGDDTFWKSLGNHVASGRKLIIDPSKFKSNLYYNLLLGYIDIDEL